MTAGREIEKATLTKDARVEPDIACPGSFERRRVLVVALATGVGIAAGGAARAEDAEPASDQRPQKADLLVFSEGDQTGKVIQYEDLPLGGPPILAWPMEPKSKIVRDGSRLNQVLVLRLNEADLDEDTRPHAAKGVIAYSAICTHAGCVVTGWVEDEGKSVLKCFCHNSEYDPRQNATVVFGPAPRHLAPLPLAILDKTLTVASGFVGRVGPQSTG